MKFAIFGLTISSCWSNSHAAPWHSLCKALARERTLDEHTTQQRAQQLIALIERTFAARDDAPATRPPPRSALTSHLGA